MGIARMTSVLMASMIRCVTHMRCEVFEEYVLEHYVDSSIRYYQLHMWLAGEFWDEVRSGHGYVEFPFGALLSSYAIHYTRLFLRLSCLRSVIGSRKVGA
jgi:hypothetical protein